jgi:esterase/lipase superfamily enzyme
VKLLDFSSRLNQILMIVVFVSCLVFGCAPSAYAQGSSSMTVGTPTVDANGVKYYPVRSVYQGSEQQIVRVLEPTNPTPGKPRRILYVLPVEKRVTNLSSPYSDGLEELRLLDVANRFNMTLIAPSFNYDPWYGDNVVNSTRRMESFIVDDLVPFGDTFAPGSVPQRYLIGFSRSGFGVLTLILRHPRIFSAAAAWDSPAQMNELASYDDMPLNFGTPENFDLYYIPILISNATDLFQQQNRLWISGDQAVFTTAMGQLNEQLTAASIPHTWVQGGTRAHSWNSGWLDAAVTDLDANATLNPPLGPAVRSGGKPAGLLAAGTSQTTLSLMTDESATCRYATGAAVAYAAMTETFGITGGTMHSTQVAGLQDGGSYTYYVRCQDGSGNVNPDDYEITFSVATSSGRGGTFSSSFNGAEEPLSENGMWDTPGSWCTLKKNNGVYTTDTDCAARLVTPVLGGDQFAEITYDQDPGTGSWVGVMTRIQGHGNGSGYLAIVYDGQVRLYRADDSGLLNFRSLAAAQTQIGVAPRRLRLESEGITHRVYFNGVLMLSFTDGTYSAGQPGVADAVFGGPTVKTLSFSAGALTASGAAGTIPPLRTGGQPTGMLAAGTSQTDLSVVTDEGATCRYATSGGVAYAAMSDTFSTTGGTTHSTQVAGLQDGGSYTYYVRCQDEAGNLTPDDYPITFSVATASGTGGTFSSSFNGFQDPLRENGIWDTPGSWCDLQKNDGVYTARANCGARLVTPVLGGAQYAEITYDQDPGTGSWVGVMTRVQSPGNGSGYLAIAFAGTVRLYRTDDTGSLNFTLLASATTAVSIAPRRLRLESQGNTHRVYFNGVQMLSFTDTTYSTGQPGMADAAFGGPTVKILTFLAGALTGTGGADITPPVRSSGQPTGLLVAGTNQTTLSMMTDESATCRYATGSGMAYAAMTETFGITGGTTHSTQVAGLQDGSSYTYYVRCQDRTGNVNPDDYPITFSVPTSSGTGGMFSSSFNGFENSLAENGIWDDPGSWCSLKKNDGVYTTGTNCGARLVTPVLGGDQYVEITYDQDPGTGSWVGVMTRVQGPGNGSGYLAIAFAGSVRLYRADDMVGSLNFTLLALADTDVGVAPRRLRLESQGASHRVYFNDALMLSFTDGTYTTGQPGIADAIFGGVTVKTLSFSAGELTSN